MFTLCNCELHKTCSRELMKKGNNTKTKSKSKFQIFLNLKGTNTYFSAPNSILKRTTSI